MTETIEYTYKIWWRRIYIYEKKINNKWYKKCVTIKMCVWFCDLLKSLFKNVSSSLKYKYDKFMFGKRIGTHYKQP